MDAQNSLIVSQAAVAGRLRDAREHSTARAARSSQQRRGIPISQLMSPLGRLTTRTG